MFSNVEVRTQNPTITSADAKILTIATHSGGMHADEIAACAFLVLMHNKLNEIKLKAPELLEHMENFCDKSTETIKIVRSRIAKVWNAADYVIDVGYMKDENNFRFDHHQAGFRETFSDQKTINLSSVGLIWKYFGKNIIRSLLALSPKLPEYFIPPYESITHHRYQVGENLYDYLGEEAVGMLHKQIYNDFIEELDADDNGVSLLSPSTKLKYIPHGNSFQKFVAMSQYDSSFDQDELFIDHMEMWLRLFDPMFMKSLEVYLSKKDMMTNIESIYTVHCDGKILETPRMIMWDLVSDFVELYITEKYGNAPLYVVYPRSRDQGYSVYALPIRKGFFELKKPLPASLRGQPSHIIFQISKIPGIKMVHLNGYLSICESRNSAIQLAMLAVEE